VWVAARRFAVALFGITLLLVGVILVFTPGPAIVVLGLALAVLAAEFTWARRWVRKLRVAAELARPSPAEAPCEPAEGDPARDNAGPDGPRTT